MTFTSTSTGMGVEPGKFHRMTLVSLQSENSEHRPTGYRSCESLKSALTVVSLVYLPPINAHE